jgi:hypothetical protein
MERQELNKYLDTINVCRFSKSFKLEIPHSSLKGVEAVTDILIDEYHDTETFIKNIFNSNKMEIL